jgi:hypothetical protein
MRKKGWSDREPCWGKGEDPEAACINKQTAKFFSNMYILILGLGTLCR